MSQETKAAADSKIEEVISLLAEQTTGAERREGIISAIGVVIGAVAQGASVGTIDALEGLIRTRLVALKTRNAWGDLDGFSAAENALGAVTPKGKTLAREMLQTWAYEQAAKKGGQPLEVCLQLIDRLAPLMTQREEPGTIMRLIRQAEKTARPLGEDDVVFETTPRRLLN